MYMNIHFDNSWNKISISLSGGADSALLAFLICQQITNQELHIISHVRCWKTKPWQRNDALGVYNWLQIKFPNVKMFRHENFIPPEMEWGALGPTLTDEYGKTVSGDNIELRSFAEYICYSYDIDVYYNAVTRNPKAAEFDGMHTRDIDPTEYNKHLEYTTHMGKLAIHPFRFLEKKEILTEYRKQNLLELFELTRSCEGVFDNLNYKNYITGQYVPLCNTCFWCKEREWAIEQSK